MHRSQPAYAARSLQRGIGIFDMRGQKDNRFDPAKDQYQSQDYRDTENNQSTKDKIGDSRYAFLSILGLAIMMIGCLFLLLHGREIAIGQAMRPALYQMLADPFFENMPTSTSNLAHVHAQTAMSNARNLSKIQQQIIVQGAALDQAGRLISAYESVLNQIEKLNPALVPEFLKKTARIQKIAEDHGNKLPVIFIVSQR